MSPLWNVPSQMTGTRIRMRVYLAGPMHGLTKRECLEGWRDEAGRLLKLNGITPIFPELPRDLGLDDKIHCNQGDPKFTAQMDRYLMKRSDAVLMNLEGSHRISVGSMVELGWASAYDIPVILVMEPGNVHEHLMTNGLSFSRVNSWKEGVDVLYLLTNPGLVSL